MSTMHTCLACGLKDWDVSMVLIEVPEAEQRIVDVAVVTQEDGHGRPTGMEQRQVRERYVNEPRCRDRVACGERERIALAEWRAQQAKPETPPAKPETPPASEDLAWLG